VLLPLGVATELKRVAPANLWPTLPLTVLVSSVFHTMDKIGEASENPFEGGPDDIPMMAMTRAIEIELREVLNESHLPRAFTPTHDLLL
jgi:ion channel-forming bestrophin family protein